MSELKKPAALQFRHNNSDEFVAGYEKDEMDKYLSEADKVIAELEEERRWRKFPDEKPKWGEEVLVVDDESKQYIVRFSHDMKWISWGYMNTCESNRVKYWMLLPKTPEK